MAMRHLTTAVTAALTLGIGIQLGGPAARCRTPGRTTSTRWKWSPASSISAHRPRPTSHRVFSTQSRSGAGDR